MDVEAADPDAEALHDPTMPHGATGRADDGLLEEVGMAEDMREGGQGCTLMICALRPPHLAACS